MKSIRPYPFTASNYLIFGASYSAYVMKVYLFLEFHQSKSKEYEQHATRGNTPGFDSGCHRQKQNTRYLK